MKRINVKDGKVVKKGKGSKIKYQSKCGRRFSSKASCLLHESKKEPCCTGKR